MTPSFFDDTPRYVSGNEYNFRAVIKDNDKIPVDPTSVTFTFKRPDGTRITLTPTRNSAGDYSVDYAPVGKGRWRLRVTGANPAVVAQEKSFDVETDF